MRLDEQYAATLRYVNQIREMQGERPLKKLPAAVKSDPHNCVIARAVSDLGTHISVGGTGTVMFVVDGEKERYFAPEEYQVTNFVADFDAGRYPSLTTSRKWFRLKKQHSISIASEVMSWREKIQYRRDLKKVEKQMAAERELERLRRAKLEQQAKLHFDKLLEIEATMFSDVETEPVNPNSIVHLDFNPSQEEDCQTPQLTQTTVS